MEKRYKVIPTGSDMYSTYSVIEVVTTYGERLSAYESGSDHVTETVVYVGNIAECEAFIRLTLAGYLK